MKLQISICLFTIGNSSVIPLLIKRGANPEARNETGQSPLIAANGHVVQRAH